MSSRSLPRFVPDLLVALALSSLPLVAVGCDDGDPECVIDTDCQLGFRCGAGGTCERIGEVVDAGGGAMDAGPRDAAVADAATDAGSPDEDAGADAGSTCIEPTPGVYTVAEPFVGCSFESGAQVRVRAGTSACGWLLESIGSPVVDGEITIDADGAIAGSSLTVEGLGTVEGQGAYDAGTSQISLSFPPSDCVIVLVEGAAS